MVDKLDELLGSLDVHEVNALEPRNYLDAVYKAKGLGDLRQARAEAALRKGEKERLEDAQYAASAKEYKELHEQVQSSLTLLSSLESFIATFQTDLSAVSGHISDLQTRSKAIEARLDNRKAVRDGLAPVLANIAISPALIATLMETEPSEAWLQPIADLEKVLLAIRTGPRVDLRKDLDGVAEKLRLRATGALRNFLVNLLTPYRTSITPNLSILQNSILAKYRSFYAFLQRHAARAAHEVQKAYISTAQWYYETGFRRYVRALERIRARSIFKEDLIGSSVSSETSLATLSRRNAPASMLDTPRASLDATRKAGGRVPEEDASVILAYMAEDNAFKASSEALFRSISLVLADNARAEYSFVSSFFGRPDDLAHPLTSDKYNLTFVRELNKGKDSPDASSSQLSSIQEDDSTSVISDSVSGPTSGAAGASALDQHGRIRRSSTDTIWKQVFEPSLEYARNFVASILSQSQPGPLALLRMIRLNDSLIQQLIGDRSEGQGTCPAQAMESHLLGLKLRLWPLFQKEIGSNVDSVKKLSEGNSSGMASMLGVRAAPIKDNVVLMVAKRYAYLFMAITELSENNEDDMVFNSLIRLRNEVQRLISTQASRLNDPGKSAHYLRNQYQHLYDTLTTGQTSHPRSQAEIAFWKEALRKV